MIISFDKFSRFEQPQIILCSPGSRYIDGDITMPLGELSYISDLEIQYNFGDTSELNFRLSYLPQTKKENDIYISELYQSTANRMSLFLPDIGYFQITNTQGHTDGKHIYKDITAKSCESELARKNIPYVADGVYKLVSDQDDDEQGIVDLILEASPFWSVGHVDNQLLTLYRTFNDISTDIDILSFLRNNVQKAYGCIVSFNIVDRKIDIYAKDSYANRTDIHLSLDDLITEIEITEDSDNVFTALKVTPDDSVTLGMVNPLGGNVVYNFHHYLSWMSDSLRTKMIEWENNIADVASDYQELSSSYYSLLNTQSNLYSEVQRLEILLDVYQTCKNNFENGKEDIPIDLYNSEIIAANGEPIVVYDEIQTTIDALQAQIDTTLLQKATTDSELQNVSSSLFEIEEDMSSLRDSVSFKNILTDDEYDELTCYVFEGNYTDEYIAITDSMTSEDVIEQKIALYNRLVEKLADISEPIREFEINTVDFIFENTFLYWTDQLSTGCLISVELSEDEVAELVLTGMVANYEERSASLKFGNRVRRNDTKSLFDEVLGDISISANTVL